MEGDLCAYLCKVKGQITYVCKGGGGGGGALSTYFFFQGRGPSK